MSLATAPRTHFHTDPAVRTGKAAAELLVLYRGVWVIRPALIVVKVQLTQSARKVQRGSLNLCVLKCEFYPPLLLSLMWNFSCPCNSGDNVNVRTLMRPTPLSFKVWLFSPSLLLMMWQLVATGERSASVPTGGQTPWVAWPAVLITPVEKRECSWFLGVKSGLTKEMYLK